MNCKECSIECQKFGKHRNGLQRFHCLQCGRTYTEEHARLFGAMIVPEDKALLAIQLLIEGTSIRSAERITGLHRDTIIRLLVLAGERCLALMDTKMRNLRCNRIQSDEIWTFVGKKQRWVRDEDSNEIGDAWVFVAIDADTKLIPTYAVGKRNLATTDAFIGDLKQRLAKRVQLTTDGFRFYVTAVKSTSEPRLTSAK
jgi:transposase-like protein/IS1 family transposase